MSTAAQRAARLNNDRYGYEICAECGIQFGMPEQLQTVRLVDGQSFYCPLGHSQFYVPGKTRLELATKRAQELERALANRDEDLRAERASHSATKGQLTKTTKRVAGGVCPCCNRSFVQLARHMAGQHPDYVDTDHNGGKVADRPPS